MVNADNATRVNLATKLVNAWILAGCSVGTVLRCVRFKMLRVVERDVFVVSVLFTCVEHPTAFILLL